MTITAIDRTIMQTIADTRSNRYSQFGEDGILETIFKLIGIANKWCFEAGASDGIFFSNTRNLVEQGWKAILVESDPEVFQRLLKNATPNCICENVKLEPQGQNSLDGILRRNNAPKDIDLVVIDIDGQDWHIWNSLLEYCPRVVVIEHSIISDEERFRGEDFIPTIGGDGQAGSNAVVKLACGKGYVPIVQTMCNTICVKAEIAPMLGKIATKGVKNNGEMIKLNLGAGELPIEGFISIDRKTGGEAYPLQCEDNSVDEIRASHVLEHFSYYQVPVVVKHWASKLKRGGLLRIAVPDFKKIASDYVGGKKTNVLGYTMGGQTDENDYHKSLFDRDGLAALFNECGLDNIQEWKSEIQDCASLPVSLNLQGTKPLVAPIENKNGKTLVGGEKDVKICAVMSMPRLAFADNIFCAIRAFLPLGIALQKGSGAFWGQTLTQMLEKHLDDGTEYVFVLDYDTWFTKNHVIKLCQLAMENPEADAIVSMQTKREADTLMIGIRPTKEGNDLITVPISDFKKPLTPIVTGHFGLTLFKMDALRKLSRPWFWTKPSPDGTWHENHLDEDIYFWNHFHDEGFKAFLANDVRVGHIQLVCTFPGTVEENWKPKWIYMNDLEHRSAPAGCIPDVKLMGDK